MIGKTYIYKIHLIGEKETWPISYERGLKLAAALAEGKAPKHIYVDGELLNTGGMSLRYDYDTEEYRELTAGEEQGIKKLAAVTGDNKLLPKPKK